MWRCVVDIALFRAYGEIRTEHCGVLCKFIFCAAGHATSPYVCENNMWWPTTVAALSPRRIIHHTYVTAEQSSVQEAMVADLRVLRRKYDRALETIDALQENLKTRELSITSLKKRIAEDSENFDSREKSLQASLHESEARFKNNSDRLKQEMSDIKAARSELEKRQVRVDAQLQNERASGAQNVHKIEAELRADLSKSKAQIQHLQASAIELKTQLT